MAPAHISFSYQHTKDPNQKQIEPSPVSSCWIENSLNLGGLKQFIIIAQDCVGWLSSARWFYLRSVVWLQLDGSLRLKSSEGLTGLVGQVGCLTPNAGYQLGTQRGLPTGAFTCGFSMHLGPPSWVLTGSIQKCPFLVRKQKLLILRPGPRNWHVVASAIFY